MRKFFQDRYEKHYKNSRFHLIADLVFVVVIILLIGTFFAIRSFKPNQPIDFSIKAETDKVTSGARTTFDLSYKTHQAMTKNTLNIKFPDNFVLDTVEPADLFNRDTNTVTLPDLAKGASGSIKFTGVVLGEIGAEQGLSLTFDCQECNSGVLASVFYHIQQSALTMDLVLPDAVYQGVEFNGQAVLKNNGDRDMENIHLKINDQWNLTGTDAALKDGEIQIDKIAKGESKTVNFQAITKVSQDSENLNMTAALALDGQDFKQVESAKNVNIKVPNFKVAILADKNVIAGNDELTYDVTYKNQESIALRKLNFTIKSSNDNFSLGKVSLLDSDKPAKLTGNVLALDSDLNAGGGGHFRVSVSFRQQKAEINPQVSLALGLEYNINGQILKYDSLSDPDKVMSALQVKSGAYYYSSQGDQLGIGPLPPVVDMATEYWVFWNITNMGNGLDNIQVSADLPDNIVWTNNESVLAGDLKHGEVGGRVIWNLDSVPNNTDGNVYKAGFEIGIIPTADDAGKVLTLLKNISYTAHDSFTDKIISGNLPNLDTNLASDMLGAGKGQVLPTE